MRARVAASLALVAALVLPVGLSSAATPTSTPTATQKRVAKALGADGEIRGVSLNPNTQTLLLATVPDFPRMALDGITSVTVYIYLYVDSPSGNTVTTGLRTPSEQELRTVVSAAQASGLDVHFMPVLLDRATNSWRGYYVPSDLRAFFTSYTAAVNGYADLAQELGITLFYVGSENESIRRETARWKALIASVRTHYSGALTYLSTPGGTGATGFWRSLDLAAISPYYSLGTDKVPSYERALSAWRDDIMPSINRIRRIVGVPLIFGEVGYHSQEGTFEAPAHGGPVTALPSPEGQANAYAALLDTLKRVKTVKGVTWFAWVAGTTVTDTGYSPANKPAECEIAARWSKDATVRSLALLPTCNAQAAFGGPAAGKR